MSRNVGYNAKGTAFVELTLAERITIARRRAGFTQQYVANATGLSTITISHYESGRHAPEIANLAALCFPLGVYLELTPHEDEMIQRWAFGGIVPQGANGGSAMAAA